MEKHYEIKFKYWDEMSGYEERTQQCYLYTSNEYQAREKCKELYGLGIDCDYEIVSVTEI